jgi:hypothetical protein
LYVQSSLTIFLLSFNCFFLLITTRFCSSLVFS